MASQQCKICQTWQTVGKEYPKAWAVLKLKQQQLHTQPSSLSNNSKIEAITQINKMAAQIIQINSSTSQGSWATFKTCWTIFKTIQAYRWTLMDSNSRDKEVLDNRISSTPRATPVATNNSSSTECQQARMDRIYQLVCKAISNSSSTRARMFTAVSMQKRMSNLMKMVNHWGQQKK